MRSIIEDAAAWGGALGSNAQKIADVYNAYLDQDAIDGAGLAPIAATLDEIGALRTHEQVVRFAARPDLGLSWPIAIKYSFG